MDVSAVPEKSIVTVGFTLPLLEIDDLDIRATKSLLEYDITIFRPTLHGYYASSSYQGRPLYGDDTSSHVMDAITHWRNQLVESTLAGRTVIIITPQKKSFFVASGKKEYSGTGRNRHVTNIVNEVSNFDFFPVRFKKATSAGGKRISPTDANLPFNSAWSKVKHLFGYSTYFDLEKSIPLLKVSGTENVVGALFPTTDTGAVFVLPEFLKSWDDYWVANEDDPEDGDWSPEGMQAANALVSFALELDASRGLTDQDERPPQWVNDEQYHLRSETEKITQGGIIRAEISALTTKLQAIERELVKIRSGKQLLFGKGPPLEGAIRDLLNRVGIEAQPYVTGDREFDIVFEINGIRTIGEVEGKDSKAISVEKISQLERCIHEDFSREDVTEFAKGILFGNPFRLTEPSLRSEWFTPKVISAAVRTGIVLVKTTDLFPLLRKLDETEDPTPVVQLIHRIVTHPGGVFDLSA